MNMRHRHLQVFVKACLLLALPASAQAFTPQAYSLDLVTNMTTLSMFSGRDAKVTAHRSGSRELVEVSLKPHPGEAQKVQMQYLFDFEEHKAYRRDLENNSCSWMSYVSANAPQEFDPFTVSGLMLPEVAGVRGSALYTETVNGIPTVVHELPLEGGQGMSRFWISEQENLVVKMVATSPEGKPMIHMEVTRLSYDMPSEAFFVVPANCSTRTEGNWSETGMQAHAETSVSMQTSGSIELVATSAGSADSSKTTSPTKLSGGSGSAASLIEITGEGLTDEFKEQFARALLKNFVVELQKINSKPAARVFDGTIHRVAFYQVVQDTSYSMYDGFYNYDGKRFTAIENPTSGQDMPELQGALRRGFKLTDASSQDFHDALAALYQFKEFDGKTKAIRHNGNQWVFLKDEFFDKFNGFIVTTAPDGSIARVEYSMDIE